jgi:DNA-binding transcriptional MerR regulator
MPTPPGTSQPAYSIGALARLTGVSREKIRIWERRYAALTPARDAGNQRRYSETDVARLILLRRLVDAGHAIGSIAALDADALERLLEQQAANREAGAEGDRPASALVVGAEAGQAAEILTGAGIAVWVTEDAADAAQLLTDAAPVEAVILATPTLLGSSLNDLLRLRRQAPTARLLLIYRFAGSAVLGQARALGIAAVKAPLQPEDLALLGAPGSGGDVEAPDFAPLDPTRRQYSEAQLDAAARRSASVKCECPRHLVNLVRDLNAFEDYSLACEVESPQDAALHRQIYRVVAEARALVETALGVVAAEEDIEL